MPPIRLLTPQEQTFKMAMSVIPILMSVVRGKADQIRGCHKQPLLTRSGRSANYAVGCDQRCGQTGIYRVRTLSRMRSMISMPLS